MHPRFIAAIVLVALLHLTGLAAWLWLRRAPAGTAPADRQEFQLRPDTPPDDANRTPPPTPPPNHPAPVSTYTVQPGDSYWRIATRHGCTVDALLEANKHDRDHVLQAGETLTIPNPAP